MIKDFKASVQFYFCIKQFSFLIRQQNKMCPNLVINLKMRRKLSTNSLPSTLSIKVNLFNTKNNTPNDDIPCTRSKCERDVGRQGKAFVKQNFNGREVKVLKQNVPLAVEVGLYMSFWIRYVNNTYPLCTLKR